MTRQLVHKAVSSLNYHGWHRDGQKQFWGSWAYSAPLDFPGLDSSLLLVRTRLSWIHHQPQVRELLCGLVRSCASLCQLVRSCAILCGLVRACASLCHLGPPCATLCDLVPPCALASRFSGGPWASGAPKGRTRMTRGSPLKEDQGSPHKDDQGQPAQG